MTDAAKGSLFDKFNLVILKPSLCKPVMRPLVLEFKGIVRHFFTTSVENSGEAAQEDGSPKLEFDANWHAAGHWLICRVASKLSTL